MVLKLKTVARVAAVRLVDGLFDEGAGNHTLKAFYVFLFPMAAAADTVCDKWMQGTIFIFGC